MGANRTSFLANRRLQPLGHLSGAQFGIIPEPWPPRLAAPHFPRRESILPARRIGAGVFILAAAAVASAQSLTVQQVWLMQHSDTTAGLRGIDAVDGTVAWASGTGGTFLRTTDGGAHWTCCATPDAGKDGATLDFRGIQAWDAQTAIVMASGPGAKSRLYKTTDGCKTWTLLFTNPAAPNGFFDCLNLMRERRTLRDDEGFGLLLGDSVADEISVFETRDGGHSWIQLHDPQLKTEGVPSVVES